MSIDKTTLAMTPLIKHTVRSLLSQSRRPHYVQNHLLSRSIFGNGGGNFLKLKTNRFGVSKHPLSSATSSQTTSTTSNTVKESTTATTKQSKKKDDSNIFLDNLGKIFLTVIGSVIVTLVRSSKNSRNRIILRDELEDEAVVDPMELDDMRVANSQLSADVFRTIVQDVYGQLTDGECTYTEFVKVVRSTMIGLKGEAFTIQLGHLLDRIVVHVLNVRKKSSDDKMPLSLWLSTLTIALNSSVGERLRILYEILEKEESPVTFAQVLKMIGYLQDTWQLPADTQLIATDEKFPTQQWKVGSPKELVPWDGLECDQIDVDAFAKIITSRAVCAWGECYHKKKFETVDEM